MCIYIYIYFFYYYTNEIKYTIVQKSGACEIFL